MFGIENYPLFITSGILLNITPGADTIYILTRSIAQGRRAGVFSVLGIAGGAIVHTVLAAFGLAALCSRLPVLFTVITFLGGGYLMYLGISTLSGSAAFSPEINKLPHATSLTIYRQGFLTNLLNPKVALFYLSFMPQFISPACEAKALPFLLLGATFITTGTTWCMGLALFSSRFTELLRLNRRFSFLLRICSGMVFIGLGIRLLLERL
jgi:threonine/homoserine/homoserine lactone efflux protein